MVAVDPKLQDDFSQSKDTASSDPEWDSEGPSQCRAALDGIDDNSNKGEFESI
jgi:hypothetical protein